MGPRVATLPDYLRPRLTLVFVGINLLTDVLYVVLDPRIVYS